MSFGATKSGAISAEAVIFFDLEISTGSDYIRKQVTQLASKMRYLAAQFNAILADDLWIELGANANQAARSLHDQIARIPDVHAGPTPPVNSIYPKLPAAVIKPLQDWSFFWDWNPRQNQVRWMTGWDTTQTDIDAFTAGVQAVTAQVRGTP